MSYIKVVVETIGPYMLIDPMTGDEIPFNRPAVVKWSSFLDSRLAAKQLRILETEINPEATDADFMSVLDASGGDFELALAAFKSEFAPIEPDPAPTIADTTLNPVEAKKKK